MTDSEHPISRSVFGWPRIGTAWISGACGIAWLVVLVLDAAGGRSVALPAICAGSFLLIGATRLVVAIRDRRRGTGAYAPAGHTGTPVRDADGPDGAQAGGR